MTHGTSTSQAQPSPATTSWPAGVHTRYLTAGGATVDVRGTHDAASYKCWGCGDSTALYGDRRTKELAQGHARKCTAFPRPRDESTARQPNSWPDGVTHRFLTKAAEITGNHTLAVEVSVNGGDAHSRCTGCGHPERTYYAPEIKYRAQQHAEKCRAVPRTKWQCAECDTVNGETDTACMCCNSGRP